MSIPPSLKFFFKRSQASAKRAIFPRVGKAFRFKPSLSYFEFNVVDHCNLNCEGCDHFSPIADEWFADPDEYSRDIQQLRGLFSRIHVVRLMGGEPLLHPNLASFIRSTKAFFPKAHVRIATNGVLLPQMDETLWEACRSCSVTIDVTLYPPTETKERAFIELANAKGVKLCIQKSECFHPFYTEKAVSDFNFIFEQCRGRWNAPILREGKLYICSVAALINIFNKKFGTNIPRTGCTDIYKAKSGWDVIKILSKGAPICSYCTLGWDSVPAIPWSTSKGTIDGWDATSASNF